MTLGLDVDLSARAAYIRLSREEVMRTVEVTEAIMIDLDAYNVVVGIEVLDLAEDLPFGVLTDQFHVHTDVIEELRLIQPSVQGFLSLQVQSEGETRAVEFASASAA